MKKIITIIIALCVALSCNKLKLDNNGFKNLFSLTVIFPENYDMPKEKVNVNITNIHTNENILAHLDANGCLSIEIESGIYNITVSDDNKDISKRYNGSLENVSISENNKNAIIYLNKAIISNTWVISEIHFTANETPNGYPYFQDGYIELHNNSNKTLYADSLCISRAYTLTNEDYSIWEHLKDDIVPFYILSINGSGKEYPVPPGGKLLVAVSGINHNNENPASKYDLSKADFEIYSPNSLSSIDAPDIKNINIEYCAVDIAPILFSGSEALFIFKPDSDLRHFLSKRTVVAKENNGDNVNSYAIPIANIIDAVHIGESEKELNMRVFPPYMDAGHTYCKIGKYNFVSRRKVVKNYDGREILQDTNNSTNDFLPNQLSKYLIQGL